VQDQDIDICESLHPGV